MERLQQWCERPVLIMIGCAGTGITIWEYIFEESFHKSCFIDFRNETMETKNEIPDTLLVIGTNDENNDDVEKYVNERVSKYLRRSSGDYSTQKSINYLIDMDDVFEYAQNSDKETYGSHIIDCHFIKFCKLIRIDGENGFYILRCYKRCFWHNLKQDFMQWKNKILILSEREDSLVRKSKKSMINLKTLYEYTQDLKKRARSNNCSTQLEFYAT